MAAPRPTPPALGPADTPGDHGGGVQPHGEPPGDAAGGLPDALDFGDLPAGNEPMPGVVTVGDAPSFPGDHAPAPDCPRCGSLELWWDLWGGVHCQHCDAAAFERSRRWAERAVAIRRRMAPAPVATG